MGSRRALIFGPCARGSLEDFPAVGRSLGFWTNMLIQDACWQKDSMSHLHDWVVKQTSPWIRCLTKAVRLEMLEAMTLEVVDCYWSTASLHCAMQLPCNVIDGPIGGLMLTSMQLGRSQTRLSTYLGDNNEQCSRNQSYKIPTWGKGLEGTTLGRWTPISDQISPYWFSLTWDYRQCE